MKKNKKWYLVLIAALVFAVSAVCGVVAATAEGTADWTAMNADTTVAGDKITSGATDATNDLQAKYGQTIDLAKGFDLRFTVSALSGDASNAWTGGDKNSVGFILTGAEADTTAQNAVMFSFGKLNNKVRLYTYYLKNFKLDGAGKFSYSLNSGYYDNTTWDQSFDTEVAWTADMQFRLRGKLVEGLPTFFVNDSMVNPFGGTFFDNSEGKNSEQMLALIEDYYSKFQLDSSAMSLYAYSKCSEAEKTELTIQSVEKTTSYSNGGWIATDGATVVDIANGAKFSKLKGIHAAGDMPRTKFIYEQAFDLTKEGVTFTYNLPASFKPDNQSFISVRKFGADQITSAKSVANRAYETFLFSGGATIGLFDNGSGEHWQPFGIKGGAVGAYPIKDKVENGVRTRSIYFGPNGNPNEFCYKINGATVINYTKADLEAVMGDLTSCEIEILPNAAATKQDCEITLYNFAKMPVVSDPELTFVQNVTEKAEFDVTLPKGVNITSVKSASGAELAEGTWSFADGKLSFDNGYLNRLAVNDYAFTVVTDANTTAVVTVSVQKAVTITTGSALTAKYGQFAADVVLNCSLADGEEISAVLVNEEEFDGASFDGGVVTITKEALNKLYVGTYTVEVKTNFGSASKDVTVQKVAEHAPVLADGQVADITDVDVSKVKSIEIGIDLKDAAYYYVLLNGEMLSEQEAVFNFTAGKAGKLVLTEAFVKKMPVGLATEFSIVTDGGKVVFTVRATLSFEDWNVMQADSEAPVLNDDKSITMTGYTRLVNKKHFDLADGMTFEVRFDEFFDYSMTTPSNYVEFVIYVKQGDVRIETHIRVYGQVTSTNKLTTETFQQVWIAGETQPRANDRLSGRVALDKAQTYSIKLLGNSTVLTMFNHLENRENGLPVSFMDGAALNDAEVSIYFDTNFSAEHKADSKGTFLGMKKFTEEKEDLPVWAQSYFMEPLETPVLSLSGNTLSWNEVEGAQSYVLYVDGESTESLTGTSFDLTGYFSDSEEHSLQIKAIANKEQNQDSALSEAVTFKKAEGGKDDDNKDDEGGKNDGKGCGTFGFGGGSGTGLALAGLMGLAALGFALRKKED